MNDVRLVADEEDHGSAHRQRSERLECGIEKEHSAFDPGGKAVLAHFSFFG